MSPLLHSTQELIRALAIRKYVATAPSPNPGLACGRFAVLPRTDGTFIAFEYGRALGEGVRSVHETPWQAFDHVMRLADIDAASGRLEAAE